MSVNKSEVLRALKTCDGPVSGEALSRTLGISRVAVWKHVRDLRTCGYGIESSPSGYRLISVPDLLLPCEFPGWEARVHYFPEVDSTMRVARDLARSGAAAGTLVVAESQSAGRGRLDRTWQSPPGGLYLTVITRPPVAPSQAPLVNLVASVSVAMVLRRLCRVPAVVKWPNDVLVGDRKVCGILSEMEAECDLVRYVNVGIGMNVNAPAPPEVASAASLQELTGRTVDRRELATGVVSDLLERLHTVGDGGALDDWRRLSETIGRCVRVRHGTESIEGTAVGVEDSGALIVEDASGARTSVFAGDCAYGEA